MKCEKCDKKGIYCELHLYMTTREGTKPVGEEAPCLCPEHLKEHLKKEHSNETWI